MKFPEITILKLIELIESATELFKIEKYYNRDFVEKYLGLNIHRSSFYGEVIGKDLRAVDRNKTVFNSDSDVTISVEGILLLGKEPTNIGTGEIVYTGYGVLEVDGSIIYDGRGGGGGGSDIYAESLSGVFAEQVVEGISVGDAIDHRIEIRSGRPHLILGDPYQIPNFTSFIMSSQPQIIEAGDSIVGGSRNFTWTTQNPTNMTPDDISVTDVNLGTILLTGSSNDGSEAIDIGLPVQLLAGDTQSYRITSGQLQGADITRIFSVNAQWGVFYGNNSIATLTEPDAEALTKELRTNFTKTYNLNAGGYKWICYPISFGLATNFIDTGTGQTVAMNAVQVLSLTNAFGETSDYNCHRTLFQLGSNINIQVS